MKISYVCADHRPFFKFHAEGNDLFVLNMNEVAWSCVSQTEDGSILSYFICLHYTVGSDSLTARKIRDNTSIFQV